MLLYSFFIIKFKDCIHHSHLLVLSSRVFFWSDVRRRRGGGDGGRGGADCCERVVFLSADSASNLIVRFACAARCWAFAAFNLASAAASFSTSRRSCFLVSFLGVPPLFLMFFLMLFLVFFLMFFLMVFLMFFLVLFLMLFLVFFLALFLVFFVKYFIIYINNIFFCFFL